MLLLKKYFLTANALLASLLVLSASCLQGNLVYLARLRHGDFFIQLIGKLDQVSFILIAGIALAVVSIHCIVYRYERFNRRILSLLIIPVSTFLFKGKIDNLGNDTVSEIFSANAQEAADYAVSHLLRVSLSTKEFMLLMAPLVLIPVYHFYVKGAQDAVKIRDIKLAFWIIACMYAAAVLIFCAKLLHNYYSVDSYRVRLQQSTQAMLPFFSKTMDAPNIVVYIGESTLREGFGPYRAAGADAPQSNPLSGEDPNLIAFTNVITAFSHTFPSLYRTLSVAGDPYEDQFLSIRDLRRADSLSVLEANGMETSWISNQNRGCSLDRVSQLFGQQAEHVEFLNLVDENACFEQRRYDTELIHAFDRQAAILERPHQVVFLHSYAGHDNYCKNIPESERKQANPMLAEFSQKAMFGDRHIQDIRWHRAAINCYESAITYVEKNVRAVINRVAQRARPIVFIYFSDHGEDPFSGTGHDSRFNSFRHIEIPFLVYFNQAARARFPGLYRAAFANRDKRYSLEWFADSLLDLAGLSYAKRDLVSIFRENMEAPPRYALRRSDLSGNDLILAIDNEDASQQHGLFNHGHDFYRKRRLVQSLPPSEQKKICVAHADSVLKYLEAMKIFSCAEVDVTIDEKAGRLLAYASPKESNMLDLQALVRLHSYDRLLLSLQNLNEVNADFALAQLNAIFDEGQRRSVIVKIQPFKGGGGDPAYIRKIAAAGYRVFYDLPEYRSGLCARDAAAKTCPQLRQDILALFRNRDLDGLSFGRNAYPFVAALPLGHDIELSIKDASVKNREDLHFAALERSGTYLISYKSDFDY
jgi:glucan phosphoethanolaminetransferase (alkaline phosphatase superfamily)